MQPYKVSHQIISIAAHSYPLCTLLDRQQFSDELHLASDIGISDATWSLFGVVWPSSIVLATYVSSMALQGKKVLEIGCGIGLSSIVLHRMGIDITASDYHPLAQEFLELNVLGNKLPPIKYLGGNWEVDNPLLGEFDLIIGSDVLYQPAHPGQVSEFISLHGQLTSDAIIVDPNRGNSNNFSRCMNTLGYSHHFERFDAEGVDDSRCKGRILHYHR